MTNIPSWIEKYIHRLINKFPNKVVFVGVRGNIDEDSQPLDDLVNIVVVFDALTPKRLVQYDRFLNEQPERNIIIGFVSGQEELASWDAASLFQLFYDTKSVYGNLDFISHRFDEKTIEKAIQFSLTELYQMNVNNFLYEKQNDQIERMYNLAVFIIKAIYLRQTREYPHQNIEELRTIIDNQEHREIIETAIALHSGNNLNYELISERLFTWTRNQLTSRTP